MAACADPLPSNAPKTNSAPAGSAQAGALPTAHILPQQVANRVIPLTPTPSLESPTIPIAATAPIAQSTEIAVSSIDPTAATSAAIATTTPGDDPAMLEALLVATINQIRVANGLPPYQFSPELSGAARAHSCDLASHGLISHESSEGRT